MNTFLQKLQKDFNARITEDDTEPSLCTVFALHSLVKVALDKEYRLWTLSQLTKTTLQNSVEQILRKFENAVARDHAVPIYVETGLIKDYLEAGFDPDDILAAIAPVLALDANNWAIEDGCLFINDNNILTIGDPEDDTITREVFVSLDRLKDDCYILNTREPEVSLDIETFGQVFEAEVTMHKYLVIPSIHFIKHL